MIRTTVRLDESLYKEARKKAIDESISFADVVNDALGVYLGKKRKKEKSDFHSLAGILTDEEAGKMQRLVKEGRNDGSRKKKFLAKW